ncbi:class 1b ribonucleoside-diphosphate reductase subunit alpha [Paenibacillus alvei]|uniref:class 1b ribonucleoside-diphosphate reductase subunit alpha n=1 Tax=Paenibacillus alvei TaxID=44250 RepID=UPI0022818398|nr:class 1b ribonucleoside-diphosphate reductase subunit alpha [Paenibacillus alvei]
MKDGKFQFEKDKDAVKEYMIEHVNKNTVFFHSLKEKLDYLFENNYYDKNVFEPYTYEQIKEIFDIAYSKKFRFESFMSAYKFYNNYALKTDDDTKFLERFEDRVAANALVLADGDFEKAKQMVNVLIEQCYQPATPTYLNAGRKRAGDMVSCFLIDIPDSTEGITYAVNAAAQLSRRGGGVGINLSRLRAYNDPIKNILEKASSVVGVAKILEDTFNHFNQLGQRNGSGVAYLNIFHMDIDQFLETRKINVDHNTRLKSLSIGVIAPSKFFELAEKDLPFFVFSPYDVKKQTGIELADIDMNEWYDKLVDNKNIRKEKRNARQMLTKIAQTQMESGYPYWMFPDNANKADVFASVEDLRVGMSNLCNEIYQVSSLSHIAGYDGVDNFGTDISCNLGSLNIAKVMENKNVKESVQTAIDALNTVARNTNITSVPTIANGNNLYRSVGLGAMNLHGFLAKNKIMFESEEAKDFANVFFAMVRYYAIERSMQESKRTGFVFHRFDESEYAKGTSGNVFKKYVENDYLPMTDKVKSLFLGIYIPTREDWEQLANEVAVTGIANAYLMAIAPTGSISYVANATASIAPITQQIETRSYGDSTTHYPMPYLTNENFWFYKEAYKMDMFKFIDLVATIQQHVDQGISTILYIDSEKTTREISRYYIYAHKKGLKGLYYTRTNLKSVEECLSCSV